jgi:hypothetical protein
MPDPDIREVFHRSSPLQDIEPIGAQVGGVGESLCALAGSSQAPHDYGWELKKRTLPAVLPFFLNSSATFASTCINGRHLLDDVMDVVLTLATNSPLSDGVRPDQTRMRRDFPYFGFALRYHRAGWHRAHFG